jgi:site-specific DNA recombinase
MKSIAIYARVSSERQARQATIDSQVEALKQRVAADGHVVFPTDLFVDDGYSGSSLRRPALERLRDRVAEGSVDVLYVHGADRLARRYAHQVLLLEEFAAHRVSVVMLLGRNGETAEDELLVQVQGVIAEYERAKILERSRRGKLHKARQGIVNPLAGAPYGYVYVKKSDGIPAAYRVSLPEAKVVRRIYDAIVREQKSLGQVARMLNEERVPTRGASKEWTRTALHEVLENPAYMGKAAFCKTESIERTVPLRLTKNRSSMPRAAKSSSRPRPADQWITVSVPPIISEELFVAGREQMARNKLLSKRNRVEGRYLLAGLTVCARCGYAYYGRTNWKTEARGRHAYPYYRCSGSDPQRFVDGAVCKNNPVNVAELERHVWQSVAALVQDPSRVIEEWSRRTASNSCTQIGERSELMASLKAHERALQRLLDAYEAGALDIQDLKSRSERVRGRLANARRELDSLDQTIDQTRELKLLVGRVEDFTRRVRDGLDRLGWSDRRAILRALVARIEIDDDDVNVIFRVPSTVQPTASPTQPAGDGEVVGCVGGVLTRLIR